MPIDSPILEEVIGCNPLIVTPDTPLLDMIALMSQVVVSWDSGKGLGVVSQTSLLRVFDPVEMYGVIEVLQRTIQQLEVEKAELLQNRNLGLDSPKPCRTARWRRQMPQR